MALRRAPGPHSEQPGLRWIDGRLEDPPSYQRYLGNVDAIVHLGMSYRAGRECSDTDLTALRTFLSSGKRLVYTGNLFTTPAQNAVVAESTAPESQNWRNDHEILALSGFDTVVIRPGYVYGGGDDYFWPAFAPDRGQILWCGDASSRWPMVHIEDVIRLYETAAERSVNGVLHAVADQPVRLARLLSIVASLHGAEPVRAALTQVRAKMGSLADHMLRDLVAENARARATGWQPQRTFETAARVAFEQYRNARRALSA